MEAENRALKRILENLIKGLLTLLLGVGVILFTCIPDQKERNFYYYAKRMGLIVISQLTRLFSQQYAESEDWREKINLFVNIWNTTASAIHTGDGQSNYHRRKDDE